ncbi:PH domain-containing protein [Candidatus Chloroploca asiatica]|uniref:DUF304 domain-containing protein n=1 Tax=Candidatus Chloroploca asiatica TaxID=1506545 RepID=A0A2H3L4D9_9CHLR|nr:PH domain-containing protein [Candidatus Chloroploca asiatica]PDV98036.1 hypothetical protein A9Q02_02845 [Candidatus Chloroploca asiatica]
MPSHNRHTSATYVFRRYMPWVALRMMAYFWCAVIIVSVAAVVEQVVFATVALIPLALALLVFLRYRTEAVCIQGDLLIFRYGVLAVRTYSLPLWTCTPDYHQPFIARMLDYGTIHVGAGASPLTMHELGDFTLLRTMIMSRQAEMMSTQRQRRVLMIT